MRQASKRVPDSAEKTVRDIRRATRRHHSAEEKIRIVLEGLRGEDSIAELCRREGINQNLYYRWSKEFLEAGKKRVMITQSAWPANCGMNWRLLHRCIRHNNRLTVRGLVKVLVQCCLRREGLPRRERRPRTRSRNSRLRPASSRRRWPRS